MNRITQERAAQREIRRSAARDAAREALRGAAVYAVIPWEEKNG